MQAKNKSKQKLEELIVKVQELEKEYELLEDLPEKVMELESLVY